MFETAKILIIDDEVEIRATLGEIFEEEGYFPILAENTIQAEELFIVGVDLVLLDIKIGNEDGIELLKKFKKLRPTIPIIMISGHGTIALTAKAFKLGAHEFMEKPLRLVHVRACVRNALESILLKQRISEQQRNAFPQPIYCSDIMRDLYAQSTKLASINEPVIVMGPSGSGKELVAQSLHYNGSRGNNAFIVTNAASLPVSLAEDELFGHEKGAFTGAVSRRIGCLERANNGTLFLDEVADLHIEVQAKLLRVLETGIFTRIGGNKELKCNVRIISATHKNLQDNVDNGIFRHDLWYRLCAFILKVPPLAKRKEDIPMLSNFFLQKVSSEIGEKRIFSEEALIILSKMHFPGNIRELKHTVTRAAVFSEKEIIDGDCIHRVTEEFGNLDKKAHIPNGCSYSHLDYKTAKLQFEKQYLEAVLKNNNNNITMTAAAIGMAQSNLSRKLKELSLT